MARKMLVVPEKKEVIERMGKRYDYLRNNEKTYGRTHSIEILNKILSTAVKDTGFSSTVNIAVPDPSVGINELAMSSLPGLLKCSTVVVENGYEEMANSRDVHERMAEVDIIAQQMKNASVSEEEVITK